MYIYNTLNILTIKQNARIFHIVNEKVLKYPHSQSAYSYLVFNASNSNSCFLER